MVAFGNGPACTPHPPRSTTKMANIGIPTKLLHEALGHVITVELKTGQVYRGKLFEGGLAAELYRRRGAVNIALALVGQHWSHPYRVCGYQPSASHLDHIIARLLSPESPDFRIARALDVDPEDSLSISLTLVTVTHRDGRVTQLDQVYIRGSSIRFYVVPDMLSQAPMFKRVGPNALKGRGIGAARGRATIMRAQARRGRGTGGGSRPPIRR
ncbi:BZ3500_MvSof-1268-A1-R1_Chr8-2g10093 [Microbotryum saponariae]|uniref:Small nuclear ribonucleoprotein Sm D3 n=1 Tax=Microbotryum saponariae TaxID=289078 RepID=A0A2X0L7W5_9BASI|nr:BZ3500_MvSof-1268-A1-R1_Chr8-2g10093 [Microbotryum saponariae]SDA01769.1 BZ3501_MvSof-1269-A2-R1_Chr8-2g09844 [Microbotryum saponariae]